MPYTWSEIERDWLDGPAAFELGEDGVVASFNTVEDTFGRDWINDTRERQWGPGARGTHPVLSVATVGQWLQALRGISKAEKLLAGVREHKRSARTELLAIHLLRADDPTVEVELEPTVTVGRRTRKPDFRARRDGSGWLYVEVSAAEPSVESKALYAALDRVGSVTKTSKVAAFNLDFFLRRTPTPDEQEELICLALAVAEGKPGIGELPHGLGVLRRDVSPPGVFTGHDPDGEGPGPKLSAIQRELTLQHGKLVVDRSMTIRIRFEDDRGAEFLEREAAQLPAGGPGLIILFPESGGWERWTTLIKARLDPLCSERPQVSAVCLVASNFTSTPEGRDAWRASGRLIKNVGAAVACPAWVTDKLAVLPDAGGRDH